MVARPAVQAENISKAYRDIQALDNVDLKISPGLIHGLIGPDGAGKSSLMRIMAGVLSHDSGRLSVFGREVTSARTAEDLKSRLGYMSQGLGRNLYPELSVEENINFFLDIRDMKNQKGRQRMEELLERTRLDSFRDRPMKHLSGGMKQKLALTCTLVHEPEILILDEPTTGVDPVARRQFWALLNSLLQQRSLSILVSTAYMDEASRFQHLTFLHQGRVLAQGEPDRIRDMAPGQVASLRASPQTGAIAVLKQSGRTIDPRASRIRVFMPGKNSEKRLKELRKILEKQEVQIDDARTEEPDFEDLFIELLRRQDKNQAASEGSGLNEHQTKTWSEQDKALEVQGLVKDFNGFRAVDQVSLSVQAGEIYGLIGANGAGKTTAIKMLVGILKPSDGTGQVAGGRIPGGSRDIRRHIGYMSQVFSLYQDLTVLENIKLYGGVYGLDSAGLNRSVPWLMETADLEGYENSLAGNLPAGVRQRLALSCALVHQPRLLFLDEPTSGVDPVGRLRFWDILFNLSRNNRVSILLTTHHMKEAGRCDRVGLMYAGKMIAQAGPGELRSALSRDAGQLLEIKTSRHLKAYEQVTRAGYRVSLEGRRLRLFSHNPDRDMRNIRRLLEKAGIQVGQIHKPRISMEDVFVYRVEQQEADS